MLSELKQYHEWIYPFHMPGHKLGRLSPLSGVSPYEIDVTEVEGTDNLHDAQGIIREAQERAARIYGSRETFFLVNGSSSGLLSAISACCRPDGAVLIARNSHKSVYHGVYVNRLRPYYLYPERLDGYDLLGGISPKQVDEALMANPEIDCVLITSPTFEGFVSDVGGIAEVVHRHGKCLIVDEAHGAHFPFDERFPKGALAWGADLVIHSVHKTLPALTQSSMLHVGTDRVDRDRLRLYLSIYQSTSPSYVLMTGIDECLSYMDKHKKSLYDRHFDMLDRFYEAVEGLKQFRMVNDDVVGRAGILARDPSKLVLLGRAPYTIDGKGVDRILRAHYRIQVEMSTQTQVLAMATVADEWAGFDRLISALKEIDTKMPCPNREKFDIMNITSRIYDPFDALNMDRTIVALSMCEGLISAGFVVLYPPGIPILVPGEVMTGDILERIRQYRDCHLTVQGLEDGGLWAIGKG